METEELIALFELIEKRLPRAEAQAVCLRYREGLNTKETAEKLGVALVTARTYVCEALSGIRCLLAIAETEAARRPAQ